MSSGTELSSVVFGQHVHSILILKCFFFWGCLKDDVYNSYPRTEELKENIRREIANIFAEQLQWVNQSLFCHARNVYTLRDIIFNTPVIYEQR
jgi:hypothetical protein